MKEKEPLDQQKVHEATMIRWALRDAITEGKIPLGSFHYYDMQLQRLRFRDIKTNEVHDSHRLTFIFHDRKT